MLAAENFLVVLLTFAQGFGVQKCKSWQGRPLSSDWCCDFLSTIASEMLFGWICEQKSETFVTGVGRKSLVVRRISDWVRAIVGDICEFENEMWCKSRVFFMVVKEQWSRFIVAIFWVGSREFFGRWVFTTNGTEKTEEELAADVR